MATRWKHEDTETLILMHAHNLWSRWYSALLMAAEEMGVPYADAYYRNCSGDGSMDHEIYVSAPVLNSKGGMGTLKEKARKYHQEMMGY